MTQVGVLALQGDFAEHAVSLRKAGADVVEVRLPRQLDGLQGLVIPGGESTTISRLMINYDLLGPIRALVQRGFPVWGTCAGAIMLAGTAIGLDRPNIGAMDMTVRRNAFGSQIDSFETDLPISGIAGDPFHAIFIRAPVIEEVGSGVTVLARLPDGRMVAARQGHMLATSFHPELTDDLRMHRYFLDLARETPTIGPK
ncbi:MAG: pyridoxal 5'-phosphate synthase glutaminase subunit PdxT [Chloroflexi bacterium]|nr:pyridoxal 5'-phosphate synthase glutaminase subunit PdxT [Chloroflexota bacterium]